MTNGLSIGDVVDLVVLYPNDDEEGRDPAAKYHGQTVWLHFPDTPEELYAGMPIRARIADITQENIRAVVLEQDDD